MVTQIYRLVLDRITRRQIRCGLCCVSLAHSKLTFEVFKLLPEYLCSSAGQMESNRGLGTSLNGSVE